MQRRQLMGAAAAAAGALAVTGAQASATQTDDKPRPIGPAAPATAIGAFVKFTTINNTAAYVNPANVGAVESGFTNIGLATNIYVNGGVIQVRDSLPTVLAALGGS